MQSGLMWAAAAASGVTFVGHVVAGGQQVARALLRSGELPPLSKWMAYFCWHVTSVFVLSATVGYGLVAAGVAHGDVAVLLTCVNAVIWLLSIGVTVAGRLSAHRMPAIWLFGLMTLLGGAALLL